MRGKSKIDLTRYVALGDSITSGYTDGALCYHGQLYSYANLLAEQLKSYGATEFKQPYVKVESYGIGFSGNAKLILKNAKGAESNRYTLAYCRELGDTSEFSNNSYHLTGPYNNLGVPGIKAIHALVQGLGDPGNGPGNYNPFFTRMASDIVNASVLTDSKLVKPTFFSLFIGNNDALTYALSGGTSDAITPVSGSAGVGFENSIKSIVEMFTKAGAAGVISNIPDLITVPYFTVVPYNGLRLTVSESKMMNKKYQDLDLPFERGKNPFVVADPLLETGVRQMKEGELVLMDILLDPMNESYLRGNLPIPKNYYLTKDEITIVRSAIKNYNLILRSVAESNGLAFVDTNELMGTVLRDRNYHPETLSISYTRKGVFSLDGLHPNAFGHALLANEFIKAINYTYGTRIAFLKMTKYKRISLAR